MSHIVVLDNEAVQALSDASHPKHRRVISHVQVVADRRKRATPISVVVPTTVRVEAGWDRTAAAWALANRLRIGDEALDAAPANIAARIRRHIGAHIAVADAHLGAVIQSSSTADRVTVITSDPVDVRAVAAGRHVVVVTI